MKFPRRQFLHLAASPSPTFSPARCRSTSAACQKFSEHIRAGKLRALGVTTATRLAALPEVPTLGEFVAGYEASGWTGLGAPKGTPAEIVEMLNREINAGLTDPRIEARFAELGAPPLPLSPADFGRLVAEETEKWGKVIRAANIKL
jgi:tripartite-type tricarboxylate transporter receptor subunit TctC